MLVLGLKFKIQMAENHTTLQVLQFANDNRSPNQKEISYFFSKIPICLRTIKWQVNQRSPL